MSITAWFFLLAVQNATFTLVSRARNSGSYGFHALAAVFSNGVWFASQFILIGMVARPGMGVFEAVELGAVYVAATVTGSVAMHWFSVKFLEIGKRKVGA